MSSLQHAEPAGTTRHASRLSQAFLDDHKILTRGLSSLLSALQQNDLKAASRIADELDRKAGPHIEFEEQYYYPEVAKTRGQAYVAGLHREHDAGRNALRTLLACGATGTLDRDDRELVVSQVREALDHAVSCGTLLSHLEALDAGRQQHLLNQLMHLRRDGPRWTKRPPSSPQG